MTKKMHTSILAHALQNAYPNGPRGSSLGKTRELFDTAVNTFSYVMEKVGSPVRLKVEAHKQKNGGTIVRGLIIFTGNETSVVDVTLSPSLVRINGRPFFLEHKRWATDLLDAFEHEIDVAITDDIDAQIAAGESEEGVDADDATIPF